ALTDAGGDLVGTRDYDVWGAIDLAAGASTGHGYLGERQDPATGLVFLRKRWYDPATGRFLTPDRAPASTDDSRTLHRYLYAAADPGNKVDRSGDQYDLISLNLSVSV